MSPSDQVLALRLLLSSLKRFQSDDYKAIRTGASARAYVCAQIAALLERNGIILRPATTPRQPIPAVKPAPVNPGRSATHDLRLVVSGGRLDVNDFDWHAGDGEQQ